MVDGGHIMESTKLKNNVNIVQAIGLSVSIMAPTASMALNVSLVTSISGCSVSIIFIIAMIITFFISTSIIKFNQYFSSAGSLYTFTEKALGKKAGFISGWCIFLAYFMFSVGCSAAFGSYLSRILSNFGILVNWLPITMFFCIITWITAYRDIKFSTKIILVLETISIFLILVLCTAIFIKVKGSKNGISLAPLKINNNSLSSFTGGIVFALLCFAGFESSSSLGEEMENPKKYIPIVIAGTIGVIGIFFFICSYSQVIGFGANPDGIKSLSNSLSPLSDLSMKYISKNFDLFLTLGIAVALFSCTIGNTCAGARILYSISRDGEIHKSLSKLHPKYDSPYIAVSIMMIVSLIIQVSFFKINGIKLYEYTANIAILVILIAYIITCIAGIIYFTKNKIWKLKNLIIQFIAIVALAITLYVYIYPVPSFPGNIFPYIVLGWIAVGLIISHNTGQKVYSTDEKL